MRTFRTRPLRALALGTVVATLASVAALPAGAAPPPPTRVIGTIDLPCGSTAEGEAAVGADVWVLSVDPSGGCLLRVDPATDTITQQVNLPSGSPGGDAPFRSPLVAAAGSLWVASTYRNEVVRVNASTGHITARIPTGRYPSYLTYGAGSVWVSQGQAASVARIDPATNTVVATVPVGSPTNGRTQPFDVTWDPYAERVLVTLEPGRGRIAAIDPVTDGVSSLNVAPAFGCGRALPFDGGFWIDDTVCANDYFRYQRGTGVTADVLPQPPDNHDYGATLTATALYTGESACHSHGCHGFVVKRDPTSGAPEVRVAVGVTIAVFPEVAGGALWVSGLGESRLVHLRVF